MVVSHDAIGLALRSQLRNLVPKEEGRRVPEKSMRRQQPKGVRRAKNEPLEP